MDKFIESFSELAGEFKKLKEENDEWRQVCDDFDTPDEVEIMIDDLKEYVDDLKKCVEELKEDKVKKRTALHLAWSDIKKLQEENEELKKKVAYLEKDNEVGQEAFRDMIKMKEAFRAMMSECGVN